MIDNFLYFLLDLLHFLDFLNERKIVFVDFRSCFLHFSLWHFEILLTLSLLIVERIPFGLRLVTDDTAFRPRGHKRSVRIDFLVHFDLLNYDLLFDDWFLRDKVLESVRVFY